MSTEQDSLRLRHMRDAAEKILAFTKGFSPTDFHADEKLQLAVIRLLEVVGEAASGLSDELKERHPEIPWSQIMATRNRLIHGYFDVDLGIVWKIVSQDVAALAQHLQTLI